MDNGNESNDPFADAAEPDIDSTAPTNLPEGFPVEDNQEPYFVDFVDGKNECASYYYLN